MEKYINKVIQGDCLEVMKELPDKCVDLVLTDPPYNASNSNIRFGDGYRTINEDWDKNFCPTPFLNECFRLLKDGGSILVFCSYHLLGKYLEYGRKVQQIIHWEHITALPAIAKVYTPTIEYIVWFSTPNYIFNKEFSGRNVIREKKSYQVGESFNHPSVKPIELIKKLLAVHSNEEDIVLDPFLGSGTTAVAYKQLDRNFIGIEISEKYCEIARQRLSQDLLF
jgi:site-specific DNA-methyltransferase (adenine-specific)